MVKIYESPDRGLTIFERDTETGKRILIEEPKYPDYWILDHEWKEITELAVRGNKALQKSLKEVKLLYNLIRNSDDD